MSIGDFKDGYDQHPWRIHVKEEEGLRHWLELQEKYSEKQDEELEGKNITLNISYFEKKVIEQALQLYYFQVDGVGFKDEQTIQMQFKELKRILATSRKIWGNIHFELKSNTGEVKYVDHSNNTEIEDPFAK